MFKMNPAAKEFVPAHILKKRQEEAERLGALTNQLDKVNINETSDSTSSSKKSEEKSLQQKEQTTGDSEANSNCKNTKNKTSQSNNHEADSKTNDIQINGQQKNNQKSINNESEYSDQALQDLIDEEDDRFLLNAGENICEFNGEQFIIPGDDDEYEPHTRAGYDFGNAEDNEDEDVCNAFEEFLENLPDQ